MRRGRLQQPPMPDPLAYFITWATYGTWLPGDERGWVEYRHGWQLPDRARYEPGPALVLIRAPGTAGNLEATLLHEFAHHAERRCAPSAAVRRRFVTAAGLPVGTAWFGGPAWERIPSERFAEAAVRYVLGEPPPHVLFTVDPDEVRAVAAWAAGD